VIMTEKRVNNSTLKERYDSTITMDVDSILEAPWQLIAQDRLEDDGYLERISDGSGNKLVGGADGDMLVASEGDTWPNCALVNGAISIEGDAGSSSGSHGIDQLFSIDAVLSSAGKDMLNGSGSANSFHAGAGVDTLIGENGNDKLLVVLGYDSLWRPRPRAYP